MGQKIYSSLLIISILLLLSNTSEIFLTSIAENIEQEIDCSLGEFDVDFYVKNESNWVKKIQKPVDTILHFNITLSASTGAYLTLTAVLPEMLTYLNATPQPREVKENEFGSKNIYWYDEQFTGDQSFYFTAQITLNKTNNCLATAVMLLPFQSDNDTVQITGSSQQPAKLIADANGPYTGVIGEDIQFTGSAKGGVQPYDYHWDFGDGSTSAEQNPIHVYTEAKNYSAILTVTDARNVTAQNVTEIMVKKTIEEDLIKPEISIISPTNGFYVFNDQKILFPIPFIIGPITVKIDAFDNESGLSHVIVYKDNKVVSNLSNTPYIWQWNTISFGRYLIKAQAFDKAGNVNTTRIVIWKFF